MELTNKRKTIIISIIIFMLLAAVITLSVFVGLYAKDRHDKDRDIESFYQSAYYGLDGNFVAIQNALAKARQITHNTLYI